MLSLSIILLVLTTCPPAQAAPLDRISSATVAISCRTDAAGSGFSGTGTVVHESGYILTSTTVVPPKALDIKCHFVGSLNVSARLIAADEKLELAVIKADLPKDAPPLTAIPLGDSRNVKVGQTAITVGDAYQAFPRSGKFTISLGIVSGIYELKRQIGPQPVYVGRAFETSATVAPYMDGGPLLDNAGRLIGMLSLNVSDARWMGVAVPIDALRDRLAAALAEDAKTHPDPSGKPIELTVAIGRGEPIFASAERLDARFRELAETVSQSVVAIEVDRRAERKPTTRPTSRPAATQPNPVQPPQRPPVRLPPDSAYREFFVRPKTPVTGVIVAGDGYVLTSFFNVSGELNSIHVVLPDGRRLPATLLGHDETKDLAMLRVQATGLTPITFAADPPPLAAQIATIGRSPDPAAITMTRGIISAVGRLNKTTLQLDAQTNYGNSGAPVIDYQGRCVGLVTQVRPDALWGQNSGIGFATGAWAVRQDLEPLKASKVVAKPKRGFLGIVMSAGNVEVTGVTIEQVQPDGPADHAGLHPKDVITRINDKPVADPADLGSLILERKPGDKVKLTVRRGGQTLELEVTLAENPYQ